MTQFRLDCLKSFEQTRSSNAIVHFLQNLVTEMINTEVLHVVDVVVIFLQKSYIQKNLY